MKFTEQIIYKNKTITIEGKFDQSIEVVDHVGWIENGTVKEKDIYGPVVKPEDIDIKKTLQYDDVLEQEFEISLIEEEIKDIKDILVGVLSEYI